ncbi:MAG: homoserine dehydrogenase [Ruminococcaceae bacterium]|nr:homoserine dehydrogenase [Oscillospiraceae bacterium]
MLKVAVLGYGVVGSGVCEVIRTNAKSLSEKLGDSVEVKYVLDIKEVDSSDPEAAKITKDFSAILNDPEISVVAEVMGGATFAYDYTKQLLLAGKHVVTSNKELVATKGTELLQIAKEKNVNYLFEASVGGGIPIIRPLYSCLAANEINRITGILNGTTNYILTKMFRDGSDFETALKEAQAKGYAERNPSADVDGIDACRKIAILSSLVFGKEVECDKVKTVGITGITATDVAYAEKMESVIKLIGQAELKDGTVYVSVEPRVIKKGTPLASIDDVFNGIMVNGNAIGEVVFYGPGAGKLPTASAVVADIIDCLRNDRNREYFWSHAEADFVAKSDENFGCYLIRTEQAEEIFKTLPIAEEVSVVDGEVGLVTKEIREKELQKILPYAISYMKLA